MTHGEQLARALEGTRDWTMMLIADLADDDWSFQPLPGLAHPLWICGHLASAQNTLVHVRSLGTNALDEAFGNHFPIGSPVKATTEHDYPPLESVLTTMADVHAATCEAVRGMNDDLLAEPALGAKGQPHPHYHDKAGAIAHCNRHEAFHAGQIATIRRLLGKPFLR